MTRKRIIIVIFVVLFLAIIATVAIIVNNSSINEDDSGRGYTEIDNLDEYYLDLPEETKSDIFAVLYSKIGNNGYNTDAIPANGAILRSSEPHVLVYDSFNKRYFGKFVVDLPKIKQSYAIEFNYNLNKNSFIGGYSALAFCLDSELLIYGDFDCKDDLPYYNDAIDGEKGR